jgi:hypothetical protein
MATREYQASLGRGARFGVTLASYRGELAVIFSELPGNTGPSITNMCEHAASQCRDELRARGLAEPLAVIHWFEYYPGRIGAQGLRREDLSRIEFDQTEPFLALPSWQAQAPGELVFDRPALPALADNHFVRRAARGAQLR